MTVNENGTVQVSFRLDKHLVERMRALTQVETWPPPPTQTDIVTRGIIMVLDKMENAAMRAGRRGERRRRA